MNSEDNCPNDIIIPYHTFCGQFWRPSLGFSNTYVRSPQSRHAADCRGGTWWNYLNNGCSLAGNGCRYLPDNFLIKYQRCIYKDIRYELSIARFRSAQQENLVSWRLQGIPTPFWWVPSLGFHVSPRAKIATARVQAGGALVGLRWSFRFLY